MIPKSSYPSDQKILRVVSINVNGLRSAEKKGFLIGLPHQMLM